MKKEIAKKWTKALRSGRYAQCNGYLKREIDGIPCYCCLGVLCRVLGFRFEKCEMDIYSDSKKTETVYCVVGTEAHTLLPKKVMNLAGMRTDSGDTGLIQNNTGDPICMTSLNDKGVTFKEIANLIDKHWKRL